MNFQTSDIKVTVEPIKNEQTNIVDSGKIWVKVDGELFGYADLKSLSTADTDYFAAKWVQKKKMPKGYALNALGGFLHLNVNTVILSSGRDSDSVDPLEVLPFFTKLMTIVSQTLQNFSVQFGRRIV